MITHIRYPEHNSCLKSQISKNLREWTLPFKKIVKCDISAKVLPILMKCCMMTHISYLVHNSFQKVTFIKFKMADAGI